MALIEAQVMNCAGGDVYGLVRGQNDQPTALQVGRDQAADQRDGGRVQRDKGFVENP